MGRLTTKESHRGHEIDSRSRIAKSRNDSMDSRLIDFDRSKAETSPKIDHPG
jgi:hypothetical protein